MGHLKIFQKHQTNQVLLDPKATISTIKSTTSTENQQTLTNEFTYLPKILVRKKKIER